MHVLLPSFTFDPIIHSW